MVFSAAQLIQWAKDGLKRRNLEVADSFWDQYKPSLTKNVFDELDFTEQTLNLLIACGYHFVMYNKVHTLSQAFAFNLKCPPPKLNMDPNRNWCNND
jgi:hypothetical protein